MKADFVAYGFEQLNQIRDCVIEGEHSNQSQKEILCSLAKMFVNMTDKETNKLTISEFVTALFVNSMKIAYEYFQNDNIPVSECAEVINQIAIFSKDLSSFIKNPKNKKTFYVSSYIAKCFVEELITTAKVQKTINLEHPIFVANYDIENGNLKEIVDGISKL